MTTTVTVLNEFCSVAGIATHSGLYYQFGPYYCTTTTTMTTTMTTTSVLNKCCSEADIGKQIWLHSSSYQEQNLS